MQAAIRRVLPAARQRLARSQRFGLPAVTRSPLAAHARCFTHTPSFLRTADDNPRMTAPSGVTPGSAEESHGSIEKENAEAESQSDTNGESTLASEASPEEMANGVLGANGGEATGDRPIRRGRPVGSKSRSVVRKTTIQFPRPVLPEGFLERGVLLKEDNTASPLGIFSEPPAAREAEAEAVVVVAEPSPSKTDLPAEAEAVVVAEPSPSKTDPPAETEAVVVAEPSPSKTDLLADGAQPQEASTADSVTETAPESTSSTAELSKERYFLHECVWREIVAHVRTGLLLPKGAFADGLASTKSHCLLHLPKEGGVYYLDAVAEKVAAEVGADLVRIDVQDFAEIAGDFLGDSRHISRSDISSVGIRSLPFDAQATASRHSVVYEDENAETTEEAYDEDEDVVESPSSAPPTYSPPSFSFVGRLPAAWMASVPLTQFTGSSFIPLAGAAGAIAGRLGAAQEKEQMLDKLNERKMASLLEAMISASQTKRASQLPHAPPSDAVSAKTLQSKTIIHIRGYKELERTDSGEALLRMLHQIVQDRRRDGEKIVVLGTTSAEEDYLSYSRHGVKSLQSRSDEACERTIVVPPVFREVEDEVFSCDRDARIREVNVRHLRDVIRRRSGEAAEAATLVVPEGWHLNPGEDPKSQIPGIDTTFWSFDRVHRVATVALGELSGTAREITIADIARAMDTIEKSDKIKFEWAELEQEYLKERALAEQPEDGPKPIPKNLTAHEKKLVSGIIDPKNIHHGFSSVRAPPETIEAMKTLTSLSLIRPEAFKYGVLATDRIPGVLLYGPPGTGKTLLARAVAKESGATVLEVSGGDIFNMYVGESEKNVKAIFSLAKKLGPCVVFIDEADAIFGSRQTFSSRSSHREIINQFLKEWADMDSTAFIMVATNRPFDLDDAILRRLPRRILIDLPTPEDRLAILKIHLAAETLDADVNLQEIADQGPLFSGSDLKNLCVSAALTCVKEENAEFERTRKYPKKRMLAKRHFDKAAEEISASISDDMGSLGLIRKFDEKYGERLGRKKKKSAWGFELGQTNAITRGEGRVRTD